MPFKINRKPFLFTTFGKKENSKPDLTAIKVKTTEVAAKILPNKNESIWYAQNLIEEKKCSATLSTTPLVKKLSENSPLAPTRSTSLSKNQEQSIGITNSHQIKKPDTGLDPIYTSALKPNSSQLFKNTPPSKEENQSTSLNNAQQSGIDLKDILSGKAALKSPINRSVNKIPKEDNSKAHSITPFSPGITSADIVNYKIKNARQPNYSNQISCTAKKIEDPKILLNPHVVPKSILKKTNQTAQNEESIQKISPSEPAKVNTNPLSSGNAFEKMQLQVEIDQLNELLKDFGIDPIK